MQGNRLWLRIVGASVIGLLVGLSGCDSASAGADSNSPPPEATLELLHDGSVLDGDTPVDFGAVSEGDSVSESFTIRNSGSATANLTGAKATITGTYADEFVMNTPAADALAPGESTTLEVIFTPTGVGSLTGETVTLSIESDAATGPPTVELSFSVVDPTDISI